MSNASLEGSASFIIAIASSGCWWMNKLNSLTSQRSLLSFKKDASLTQSWSQVKIKRIVLNLDNWAIHFSKRTLNYLNDMGWKIIFVSHNIVQRKLFLNNLKRRVSVHSRVNHIKLCNNSGGRLMKNNKQHFTKRDLILLYKSNCYNKSSI